MAERIEDYAIVGDMQSAALVCTDGSVDWLCLSRFHSEACFAAILGTEDPRSAWPATPRSTGGNRAMSAGPCRAKS